MNAPVIATGTGALPRHPVLVARDVARARAVARLGLHVVGADEIIEVRVGSGYYALAARDGQSIETSYSEPSGDQLGALNSLIVRLAEIQWSRLARGGQ